MIARLCLAISLVTLTSAGCARFPETAPLPTYDKSSGYRYSLLEDEENGDDLFVILSFSGGGTRAAALSYGVLEELRDTVVTLDGKPRNLLKEVDVISSVSGGSFTAAYYALHGEEIFEQSGRFQRNFLYRDVEAVLIRKLFNPYNWARLASPTFGRIEIATEVYKDLLFGDSTFKVLETRRKKPFLMINATDMVKGSQFTFIQEQFDPICADLSSFSVARAVAASSNFPMAFTPLTIESNPGECGYRDPPWVENALHDIHINARRYYRARMLQAYQDTERQFVHLLDGGVADNIGMRGPLTSIRSGDPALSVLEKLGMEQIDNLVVITVDARNVLKKSFDETENAPGVLAVLNSISTIPLANYSFDTIELLREVFRRRYDAQRSNSDMHEVGLYRIYVGFDRIPQAEERNEFLSIGTTFALPDETVDALRAKGRELLRSSPCFARLVGDDASSGGNTLSNSCLY